MKTWIVIRFETKWRNAKLPYPEFRWIRTKATPKRMPASIERARKFAETLVVKESDGKPFTRKLVSVETTERQKRKENKNGCRKKSKISNLKEYRNILG